MTGFLKAEGAVKEASLGGWGQMVRRAWASWSGHDVPFPRQSMPRSRVMACEISVPRRSDASPWRFPWHPPWNVTSVMVCVVSS